MQNSNPPSMQPSRPRLVNRLLLAIAGLSLVGFADAAYLTANHYFVLPLPCYIVNGCETVLHSQYSMIGPIPLAFLGVLFYLSVFFLTVHIFTSPTIWNGWARILYALTTIGLLMSVVFMSMQVFIIHAICMYCAGSALTSLLLFTCGSFFWFKFFHAERI